MQKPPPIRVAIVSDVRLYLDGIAHSLSSRDRFAVVGTATSLAEALDLCGTRAEEIVLFDMAMTDSLEIVRALSDQRPDLKIIGFAIDEAEDDIIAGAQAGIVGYVPRTASFDDLAQVLESAARDELICSPRIASQLLRRLITKPGLVGHPAEPLLTERERQTWRLLDQGLANKEIATEMGIEVTTAKNHVHNLLAKLNVSSRAEAAALRRRSHATLPSRCGRRKQAS